MIIEETHECFEFSVIADKNLDLRQRGEWLQIDKNQAAQLIEVLQKWIDGEGVE
jgi:hypothetical protein